MNESGAPACLSVSLLFEAAGKSSALVDQFSGWLLADYAAAVTFLVTNSASLSNALSPDLLVIKYAANYWP